MPEYPDITVYLEALAPRIGGQVLRGWRVATPFLLRTVDPPAEACAGRKVGELRRVGKRIAIGFEGGPWMVLHLMIAGRLHWKAPRAKIGGRQQLAAWDFDGGSLVLTEAGSKRQAAVHVVADPAELDPGGLEVFEASFPEFLARLHRRNHTLKRALTDPRIFSGIGNAYSDEILHYARLSPIAMSQKLEEPEAERLYHAVRTVLTDWTERLRAEAAGGFPEKVTAFRPEMIAHGKYLQPCAICLTKIQRIRYASNETDYCPRCQTGGKVLADRGLSRLLGADWPRTVEELEKIGRA